MEINQNAHQIINSQNLYELADSLARFIECIKAETNKKQKIDDLYHRIKIEISYMQSSTRGNYIVYEGKESVLLYLDNYWNIKGTYKENIACLQSIIGRIRECMDIPKAPAFSLDSIHALMGLTEERFFFCSKFLKNAPIKILLLDHTHKDWNCLYSAVVSVEKKLVKDCIMMTRIHPEISISPEFTFLHELGHVLHTRLTGMLFTPPASFSFIQERMFAKSLSYPPEKVSEIFADCFAIAALCGSVYERYNPYDFMSKENYLMLVSYMFSITQTASQ